MTKFQTFISCVIGVIIIAFVLWVSIFPSGRAFINQWNHSLKVTDDATQYETRKQVEDTCRAMMANYTSDKLTWEQYKDADGEKLEWGEMAKMRANRTVATYNEYIQKNRYVWKGNIPPDMPEKLGPIE